MTGIVTMKKLLAGIVLASMVAVVPAQAAGITFGFGGFGGFDRNEDNPNRLPQLAICQTEYQVRRAFAEAGYERIYLGAELSGKRVQVKANDRGRTYLINYNRCTREILDRQRIRYQP